MDERGIRSRENARDWVFGVQGVDSRSFRADEGFHLIPARWAGFRLSRLWRVGGGEAGAEGAVFDGGDGVDGQSPFGDH